MKRLCSRYKLRNNVAEGDEQLHSSSTLLYNLPATFQNLLIKLVTRYLGIVALLTSTFFEKPGDELIANNKKPDKEYDRQL